MRTTVARIRALLAIGSVFFLADIQAQTLEVFAGGGTLRDTPAANANVVPYSIALGPDGNLYVADGNNRLIKLDIAGGTATALPGLGPQPPFMIPPAEFRFEGSPNTVAFDAEGELHVATHSAIFRADLVAGELIRLTSWNGSFGTNGQMAFDAAGSLYYPEINNNAIRKRDPWGGLDYLVGPSYPPGFWGDGNNARYAGLSYPRAVAVDAEGNVYIADTGNNRVRKVSALDNIITTVAGNGDSWGPDEDGLPATQVAVPSPEAVAVDAAGNLYIHASSRLRKVSAADGTISTIAGNGEMGYSGDGGPALEASISMVWGNVVIDTGGNIYLADMGSFRVRRIDASTGIITTVLGNGTHSFCAESAPRLDACMAAVFGVDVDAQGNVFISDANNNRVRKVDPVTDLLTTFAGNGGWEHSGDGELATAASINGLAQLTTDAAGNVFVAGGWGNRVRRIDAATNIITTVAGTGDPGFSGDGGAATAARFNYIKDVAIDALGNLYLADSQNYRIRRVTTDGIVTTIAGTGVSGFSGDGGPATAARLSSIDSLEVDGAGNLLFSDGPRIRRIDAATGAITTVAGNGNYSGGDGGPATAAGIGYQVQFTLDTADNIYIAGGGYIRRIAADTGIITSLTPWGLSTFEGTTFGLPTGMRFDSLGRLYIADDEENVIFRVTGLPVGTPDSTAPVITPVVNGSAGPGGWFSSDVQVSWMTHDPESDITSSDGCDESSVTSDTAGVTFTCSATSAGGTNNRSVTIRRDTVAPTLNFVDTIPSAPDAQGWYNQTVALTFDTQDELSGVFSTSSGNPLIVSEEGTGVSAYVVVTDQAGNSATFYTPNFNIDRRPPGISLSLYGTLGSNGWYTSNVQVDWSIDEEISPIRSSEGCDDTAVVTDTAGTTFTCTATSAGGTLSHSVTIKRDATAPQLDFGAPSPAPNAAGWHAGVVSIPFTATDATSGVANTSSSNPVVISGEGVGLSSQVVVTDSAGNSAAFVSPAVNIDQSPPSVQPVIAGTLGSNGWYTSNVQVSWAIDETAASILSSNGCGASEVSTDTAGVTFTCSVMSGGGSAAASVTLKRDATPPVLTYGSASPTPNVNGWNKTNVSVPFTHSDALSGLASTSTTSPVVISTEGAGVTGAVTVTDQAGNTATFTTVLRNIDKTAPVVAQTSPANGASYGFYQDVLADFSCTDVSLKSCTGTVANGALVNTRTAGARTFTVTGRDQVSFTTAVTHNFTVASLFNFQGFLAPMNEPPTLNLVARGSLVPIRWQLPDGNGGFVTNPASFTSATVGSLSCGSAPSVPLNDVASGAAGISFDAATATFTYNWQTGTSWTGCRKLSIKLRDNSVRELRFRFQ